MDRSPALATQDLPPDLDGWRLELRDNLRSARELAAPMDAAAFRWKPGPDRWSAGQCLEHLVRSNRSYLSALDPAIEDARRAGATADGPFRYGILSRWFVRAMEPPPRRRFRAPRPFAPADTPRPPRRVLADLADTHAALETALARCRGLDLARVKVASPASRFLRLPLGQAFALLAAHERRHLWQARQVAARPDFPGGPEATAGGGPAG